MCGEGLSHTEKLVPVLTAWSDNTGLFTGDPDSEGVRVLLVTYLQIPQK